LAKKNIRAASPARQEGEKGEKEGTSLSDLLRKFSDTNLPSSPKGRKNPEEGGMKKRTVLYQRDFIVHQGLEKKGNLPDRALWGRKTFLTKKKIKLSRRKEREAPSPLS